MFLSGLTFPNTFRIHFDEWIFLVCYVGQTAEGTAATISMKEDGLNIKGGDNFKNPM